MTSHADTEFNVSSQCRTNDAVRSRRRPHHALISVICHAKNGTHAMKPACKCNYGAAVIDARRGVCRLTDMKNMPPFYLRSFPG